MNIRPVKTDQDYNDALERIEVLWGAESDTPEGDELDILYKKWDASLSLSHELFLNPLADGLCRLMGFAGKGLHMDVIETGLETNSPDG